MSEVIGAFLLISIVVAAVAIVAVVLFSQTTPQKIPNINFMTGSDAKGNIYLYHNGGDSLAVGQFDILVNNAVTPGSCYSINDGSNEWTLGKNIIIKSNCIPVGSTHTVALVYNSSGTGSVVIRSASANILQTGQNNSADVNVGSSYPPVINVQQMMQSVTNNTVYYYRENGTMIQSAGYLQFNITANSTTRSNNVPITLNPGDVVKISPDSVSQGMRVFGVGDQIWELSFDKATLIISPGGINPITYPGATINNSWITGYKDMKSTLILKTVTPAGSYFTELAWNNFPTSDRSQPFSPRNIFGTNSSTITISNTTSDRIGVVVLQFDNKTKSTYFVGSASSISVT